MIQVFTTDEGADSAGNDLTNQYNTWSKNKNIEIVSIHSNSNNYGWMLIIHYKEII